MITGAAFCPHPPLLVPEVAGGAAPELDELRTAARTAIRRVASGNATVVILGRGEATCRHPPGARGTLAGYGVPLTVSAGPDGSGPVELPLALTIGAWLLGEALGAERSAQAWSVGPDDAEAIELPDGPVALLVMGDGSARRSTSAPGYLDERAGAFDAAVADALRHGTAEGLRTDAALADELLVAGTPVWNAAATLLAGRAWDAELLYDDAPYGVGYFVAAWTARD